MQEKRNISLVAGRILGIRAWRGAEFLEQGFDSMILPAFS
jgi:hypothetical protein